MAKYGIFGSSFDPVTYGHLFLAEAIANRTRMDKVIFVPSSNKRADKHIGTPAEHRIAMLEMAIADNDNFALDTYEIGRQGYEIDTYTTMNHFKEKYPGDELYFIMGADLLVDIGELRWRNAQRLVEENKFIVMARNGIDMVETIAKYPILRHNDTGSKFHLLGKGTKMEDSSTFIRKEFAEGGASRYLFPDPCYKYAIEHKLYE